MKIPIAGGTPVTLSERLENRAPPSGATWLPDGTIVHNAAGGLWRVPATGGAPILLLETGLFAAGPMALPGGRAVLFHVGGAGGGEASLEALVLSSGERRKIVSGRDPFYVPTGHLVFARANGSLWAAPFDVDRLTIMRLADALVADSVSAQSCRISAVQLVYEFAGVCARREPGWHRGWAHPRLGRGEMAQRRLSSMNRPWTTTHVSHLMRAGLRSAETTFGLGFPSRLENQAHLRRSHDASKGCAGAGSGLGVRFRAVTFNPSWGRSGETREHPHRLDESGWERRHAGARSIGRGRSLPAPGRAMGRLFDQSRIQTVNRDLWD